MQYKKVANVGFRYALPQPTIINRMYWKNGINAFVLFCIAPDSYRTVLVSIINCNLNSYENL
ncbi:MAG: hypothetical protein U9R57_13040, partial [Thermodesulfobacteriota bacterium]|nr:hypothetical protein [Thermodesulfobacteriota bacterium]